MEKHTFISILCQISFPAVCIAISKSINTISGENVDLYCPCPSQLFTVCSINVYVCFCLYITIYISVSTSLSILKGSYVYFYSRYISVLNFSIFYETNDLNWLNSRPYIKIIVSFFSLVIFSIFQNLRKTQSSL